MERDRVIGAAYTDRGFGKIIFKTDENCSTKLVSNDTLHDAVIPVTTAKHPGTDFPCWVPILVKTVGTPQPLQCPVPLFFVVYAINKGWKKSAPQQLWPIQN